MLIADGKARWARRREKLTLLLDWLGHWRFAESRALARLVGFRNTHHVTPWLNSLAERGVLRRLTGLTLYPRLPIYLLTHTARELHPPLIGATLASPAHVQRLLRTSYALHELSLRYVVAGLRDPLAARLPDHDLSPRPDALLHDLAGRHALELELSAKSTPRVYRALSEHAEALEAGRYDAVRYLFSNETCCALYRTKFAALAWPQYHYFADTRRYVPVGDPRDVPADLPLRQRFSFEVTPTWLSLI